MLFDNLLNPKKQLQRIRKVADSCLDNLEQRFYPNRHVVDVPQRPESMTPRDWFQRLLEEVDLDWETEQRRGLFYYLDNALPTRRIDAYMPLRITFIHAGPASLETSDGSKFIPEELFSFVPSVSSAASSILGAIQADAAVNFDVEHIHLKAHSDEFERLDERDIENIAEQNDVVLLGSLSTTWARCRDIVMLLRAFNPSLILIAGGPQATIDPDYMVDAGVDYLVRYDGCVSACGLVRAIAGGLIGQELSEYLCSVPNLFYKDHSGGYQSTPKMEVTEEAGAPLPPVLSNDFYSKQLREKLRILSTGATFGCPYKCAMCNSSRIASLSKRPVEHVIADLKRLYRMGDLDLNYETKNNQLKLLFSVILGQLSHKYLGRSATQFLPRDVFFWDDNPTFTKNRKYAMELFEAMAAFYKENRIFPPAIWLQVGIDFFDDEELVRAARKAGITRISCGFEHVSENALKQIEKKKVKYGNVRTQYREAVALARKNDIAVHSYLMIGFNETAEDVEALASFFRDISVNTLQVLFVGPWRKKWMASDIPDMAKQPQFDFDVLVDAGRIPNYIYDRNGKPILTLFAGSLVPLTRAENIDYQTLFNLRRNVYKEFYTFESVLDVIKNRDRYPDWVSTALIRYQTYSKYFKYLDQFYKLYNIEKKLDEAEREYQRNLERRGSSARASVVPASIPASK